MKMRNTWTITKCMPVYRSVQHDPSTYCKNLPDEFPVAKLPSRWYCYTQHAHAPPHRQILLRKTVSDLGLPWYGFSSQHNIHPMSLAATKGKVYFYYKTWYHTSNHCQSFHFSCVSISAPRTASVLNFPSRALHTSLPTSSGSRLFWFWRACYLVRYVW